MAITKLQTAYIALAAYGVLGAGMFVADRIEDGIADNMLQQKKTTIEVVTSKVAEGDTITNKYSVEARIVPDMLIEQYFNSSKNEMMKCHKTTINDTVPAHVVPVTLIKTI